MPPTQSQMMTDIWELFARARGYEDKPHQLYSHIAAMADRYEYDDEYRAEIRRIMDIEYMRDRSKK